MRAQWANCPDWRDGAAYAPLLDADRSLFAWEWLRRDPLYRTAAAKAGSGGRPKSGEPQRFGLVVFEPPEIEIPRARPLWTRHAHSLVLSAAPSGRRTAADEIDVRQLNEISRMIADQQGEHLLLSDGQRMIRLDGPPGAFSSGAVCLRYSIEGLDTAERKLVTLRRFLALCRTGSFARSLHRRETKAGRWILLLRAQDALVAGADQRQIAAELLSSSVAEPLWRSREPSIRSRVQRLVRSASRMAGGGYRTMLR